jgi:hypothetical protein
LKVCHLLHVLVKVQDMQKAALVSKQQPKR